MRLARKVAQPTLVFMANDADGSNELEDATVLRGTERRELIAAFRRTSLVVVDNVGHCIYRDAVDTWLSAVRSLLAS